MTGTDCDEINTEREYKWSRVFSRVLYSLDIYIYGFKHVVATYREKQVNLGVAGFKKVYV